MKSNDIPASDSELDAFYGAPVTDAEWDHTFEQQVSAIDADDIAEIASENADDIIKAMNCLNGNWLAAIFLEGRHKMATRRTQVVVFGEVLSGN